MSFIYYLLKIAPELYLLYTGDSVLVVFALYWW